MNKKADNFRKTQIKQTMAQTDSNTEALQNMQRSILSLSYKLFNMERQLDQVQSLSRTTDYRSTAMAFFMVELGVNEDKILNKIYELQVDDFEDNNKFDDVRRNLVDAGEETAETGLFAITTIDLFKGGVELKDEKIVRSKVEIGKNELFPELDKALVGMKVGDTKKFSLNLSDKTDEAVVTLLGLRKAAPAPTQEQQSETSN